MTLKEKIMWAFDKAKLDKLKFEQEVDKILAEEKGQGDPQALHKICSNCQRLDCMGYVGKAG